MDPSRLPIIFEELQDMLARAGKLIAFPN